MLGFIMVEVVAVMVMDVSVSPSAAATAAEKQGAVGIGSLVKRNRERRCEFCRRISKQKFGEGCYPAIIYRSTYIL
jgi:hypothetical protein